MGIKSFPKKAINFSDGFHFHWYQIRENGFHKTENLSPPYGMKNSFKNSFPLDEIAFTRGVSEKWKKFLRDKKFVPLVVIIFFNNIILPLGSTFRKKWKTIIKAFSK